MPKVGKVVCTTPQAEKERQAYIDKRNAQLCEKGSCKTCAPIKPVANTAEEKTDNK